MRCNKILMLMGVGLAIGSACSSVDTSKEPAKAVVKKAASSSVPDPSELALLMKQLYAEMGAVKQGISYDSVPFHSLTLSDYQKIHTAIPTDSTIREKQFEKYSNAFLSQLSALDVAPEVNVYNATVDNCLACHQSYCPGPMKKIEKLRIK